MKHFKIIIESVDDKAPLTAVKEAKKSKGIKSLKDLKSMFEEEDPKLSYGEMNFGALPSEGKDETKDRVEGEQEMTPDDRAEKESKEKRTKNSKHPTIVGKMMK